MKKKLLDIFVCMLLIASGFGGVFGSTAILAEKNVVDKSIEDMDVMRGLVEKVLSKGDVIPEECYSDEYDLNIREDSYRQSDVLKLDSQYRLAIDPKIFDIMEAGKTTANDKTLGFCLIIVSNKIYVGGSTYHDGDWDAYICKFDITSGNPVFDWEETYDYLGNDEAISGLAYDAGKVFAIGYSDKGGGRQILWKFDSISGSLEKSAIMGTDSHPTVGVAIEHWNDGYLYTTGSRKNDDGKYRVVIFKYSTNLDYEWGYYLNPYPPGLSYGYDIDVSNDYAYITGDACYSGKPSYAWPCMIKFDINDESTVWSNTYGSAEYRQKSESCLRWGTRVYYVGYEYDTTAPTDYQIYLAYVRESDGWQDGTIDRFWGSSSHPDFGNDIIEYADKFYVAGTTASYGAGSYDALLLKMHPDFTQIWFKTWGGGQIDEAINADEYGGYIYTVGYTESYGSESQNAFLLKYSSNGNLQWDYVWSAGNQPPNKPSKPSGPTGGSTYTLYTYTTSATDTENDKVYYKWDWDAYGDHDYSNWLGPYPSGQQVSAKHSWDETGTYCIRVKAKDEYGESGWSDPLSGVSIPRNKIATNSLFFGSLEQFPLLMRLLGF